MTPASLLETLDIGDMRDVSSSNKSFNSSRTDHLFDQVAEDYWDDLVV